MGAACCFGRDKELEVVPRALPFADPRAASEADIGLIAFYCAGREEEWDRLCQSAFLGNFYPLPEPLRLDAPRRPGATYEFTNAEAAFQALKFWYKAGDFASLSGEEAFVRKRALAGQEDFEYGGYGSNWAGMLRVLRIKFAAGTKMYRLLQQTGDAFLLEHNAKIGRDKIWSDNCNGDGLNWLGMQLMLVREESPSRASRPWTAWLKQHINLDNGDPHDDAWQLSVQMAVRSLLQALSSDQKGLTQ